MSTKFCVAIAAYLFGGIHVFAEDQLTYVHLVTRHAQRSPSAPYPKDPSLVDILRFPLGPRQLTDAGIDATYRWAAFIQNRYGDFIPTNPKRALLRASQVDRNMDTLAIVGKYLWPTSYDKYWVQPRIFTEPLKLDGTTYWQPTCPKLYAEQAKVMNSTEVLKYDNEQEELYEIVAKNTGWPANMDSVGNAYDILKSNVDCGNSIPEWATRHNVYTRMGKVYSQQFWFWYKQHTIHKLQAGLLIKDITTRMLTAINESGSTPTPIEKFNIYALHDNNIAALSHIIGAGLRTAPNFGFTYFIELYESDDGRYKVKVSVLTGWDASPYQASVVTLPCSDSKGFCSIREFLKLTKHDDEFHWKRECQIGDKYDPYLEAINCYDILCIAQNA